MAYANTKLIVNLLISPSLLLVGLDSVHGAKQVIDIMLDSGSTIRITRKKVTINRYLDEYADVTENAHKGHIQIGSTHIDIDRSKPLIRLIRGLRATPGIKSAILVDFSLNERCENKIKEFNEIFHSDLLFSEKIKLLSKSYFSLQNKQNLRLAKKNLPIIQYKLGVSLANSADESGEEISFLQEAKKLLTQSAIAGFQPAKKTLPLVQNNLAVALANSARNSSDKIPLLKEAVRLLKQCTKAGCQLAKRNLPIEQCNLGIVLANSARNSPDKILLLRESIHFLTESVNAGDTCAREYLPISQYKLGCALANSAEGSEDEILLLEEAMDLLEKSVITGYHLAREKLSVVECKLSWARANSAQGLEDEIPLLREARYLLENSIKLGFQHTKNKDFLETLKKINQRLESLTTEAI